MPCACCPRLPPGRCGITDARFVNATVYSIRMARVRPGWRLVASVSTRTMSVLWPSHATDWSSVQVRAYIDTALKAVSHRYLQVSTRRFLCLSLPSLACCARCRLAFCHCPSARSWRWREMHASWPSARLAQSSSGASAKVRSHAAHHTLYVYHILTCSGHVTAGGSVWHRQRRRGR